MTRPGVVVLHGLGGTPHSVLPITAAVHAGGYTTVSPKVPGHGTNPADLIDRTWDEWLAFVLDTCDELAARCGGRIVVIGQSMGASLALAAAAQRSSIIGVGAINVLVRAPDPDATEHLEHLISRGKTMQPAGDPDLRDPAAHDSCYAELALTSLIQLGVGADAARTALPAITVPLFVASSDHDNVVDSASSDDLAAGVAGTVTRLRLANSGHVAALDFDHERLCRELLTWLVDLTDGSAAPA
ncbi:MAG: esterase [Ilumatobacteraceae bacterium]|nr:esterase [Ilumatobacteraceae bacterium]